MKARRHCTSCDRVLRRGSTRRAWVVDGAGAMRFGLVCARCVASRALAFIIPPPMTTPALCASCRRESAKVCLSCVGRVSDNVRSLSAANVALAAKRGSS